MDKLSPGQRTENMRRIHSKNTIPELEVRKIVHMMGFRYRLHGKLPGKPDLVFRNKKKLIFVNGCFWHQHPSKGCQDARMPKSNLAYWDPKLEKNKRRDTETMRKLIEEGWGIMVIWDCQIEKRAKLTNRIKKFLLN
ncbi:MAG: DNA mismatch endonuclease Vsr [Candidatus Atribacteria bacterium]|nr:DNA mismatch endonuclease Vsr [Candidatus Atribacteria bacterium]